VLNGVFLRQESNGGHQVDQRMDPTKGIRKVIVDEVNDIDKFHPVLVFGAGLSQCPRFGYANDTKRSPGKGTCRAHSGKVIVTFEL